MVKLTKKTRAHYTKSILDALHNKKIHQFRETFLELHPSDQADIFKSLDGPARNLVYSYLSPKEFTAIFENLDTQDQKLFFLEMDENYTSNMFNNSFTDDVVQFLTEINNHRANEILQQKDKKKADEVKAILSYAHETAGAVMTKELISIPSTASVGEVLDKLRDEAPGAEIIYYLYVVDTGKELV